MTSIPLLSWGGRKVKHACSYVGSTRKLEVSFCAWANVTWKCSFDYFHFSCPEETTKISQEGNKVFSHNSLKSCPLLQLT